jgi:hypothetical protein
MYPDAASPLKLLFKVLCDIEDLAGCTPASVGESVEWATVVSQAEENRANYCQALKGGCLHIALYGMYAVTLNALKTALTEIARAKKANNQDDDYTEVRRRKRHTSDETSRKSKKAAYPTTAGESTGSRGKVVTRKFSLPSGRQPWKQNPLARSPRSRLQCRKQPLRNQLGRPP